ncbi:MAG: ATP-binding protein, partial [Polyangiaceae bacterium]|nr:ATP-binding protein [Polyangiaceae bacterium]
VVPKVDGACIEWTIRDGDKLVALDSRYSLRGVRWLGSRVAECAGFDSEDTPDLRSIVIYQRADGGMSIIDPLHSMGESEDSEQGEQFGYGFPLQQGAEFHGWRVLQFAESDVWNGLVLSDDNKPVCRGFIADVEAWAFDRRYASFEYLDQVVGALVGSEEEFKLIRETERVYLDDGRDYLVLSGPTGRFSSAHVPAGFRRVLALAYMIVWAIRDNMVKAERKSYPSADRIVLLVDGPESYLHPKWQRTLVPGLSQAAGKGYEVQTVVATHSPLVLASIDTSFDAERDALFKLDLAGNQSLLQKRRYSPHRDVNKWLTSDAFGLRTPGSCGVERELAKAVSLLEGGELTPRTAKEMEDRLHVVLPDIDRFWRIWQDVGEKQGWLKPDGDYADWEGWSMGECKQ